MLPKPLYELNEKVQLLMNIDQDDKVRFQDIVSWTPKLMELSVKEKVSKEISPRQGEIWTCDLGQNVGSEINKVRPVLVIQSNLGNKKAPTVTIIPITRREERQLTHLSLTKVDLLFADDKVEGSVLTEQIRSVSKARFGRKIAEATAEYVNRVIDVLNHRLLGVDRLVEE